MCPRTTYKKYININTFKCVTKDDTTLRKLLCCFVCRQCVCVGVCWWWRCSFICEMWWCVYGYVYIHFYFSFFFIIFLFLFLYFFLFFFTFLEMEGRWQSLCFMRCETSFDIFFYVFIVWKWIYDVKKKMRIEYFFPNEILKQIPYYKNHFIFLDFFFYGLQSFVKICLNKNIL